MMKTIWITLAAWCGVANLSPAQEAPPTNALVVYDFSVENGPGGWAIEDDGVMGGVSQGRFAVSEEGHGVFSGEVSLENDGGFSSVQCYFDPVDVSAYKTVCLRIKGDGKPYQFIVEAQSGDRHYYRHTFPTSGEWETVRFPMGVLEPYWRGDRLDQPNFPGQTMAQARFLIGNGKAESFRLEIDAIWLE